MDVATDCDGTFDFLDIAFLRNFFGLKSNEYIGSGNIFQKAAL